VDDHDLVRRQVRGLLSDIRREKSVLLEVQDHGVGIPKERLDAWQSRRHVRHEATRPIVGRSNESSVERARHHVFRHHSIGFETKLEMQLRRRRLPSTNAISY
jgi:hypothetical protein